MKNFFLRMLFLGLGIQGGFMFTAHGASSSGPSRSGEDEGLIVDLSLLFGNEASSSQAPPTPIARQTPSSTPVTRQTRQAARPTPPASVPPAPIARQTPPAPIARQTIARQTPPAPIERPTPPSTPVETQPLIGGSALVGNPPRRMRSKAAATEVHRMMRGWQQSE